MCQIIMMQRVSIFVSQCVEWAIVVPLAGVNVPIFQRYRCDVKRNHKVHTNVTVMEVVPLSAMQYVLVHF